MRRLRGYFGAAALACVLGAGCGEELGPERFRTAVVRGTIRVGSRPVGRGWVEFSPADGTIGKVRSARLAADGSFVAEGVSVGRNQIGVVGAPLDARMSRIFHPLGSPVRRNVLEQGTTLSVDLLSETVPGANEP